MIASLWSLFTISVQRCIWSNKTRSLEAHLLVRHQLFRTSRPVYAAADDEGCCRGAAPAAGRAGSRTAKHPRHFADSGCRYPAQSCPCKRPPAVLCALLSTLICAMRRGRGIRDVARLLNRRRIRAAATAPPDALRQQQGTGHPRAAAADAALWQQPQRFHSRGAGVSRAAHDAGGVTCGFGGGRDGVARQRRGGIDGGGGG